MSTDYDSIEIIADYANKLISMNEASEVVWYLARQVIAKLGFEDVVIYLVDDDGLLRQVAAGDNKTDVTRTNIVNPLLLQFGEGVVGTAAASKTTQLIADTRKVESYIVDDDIRLSELAVPMIASGELIGVIDSEHHQAHFFTDYHVKLLTILAGLTANKLVQAKNHAVLQTTIEKLEYNSKIQNILFEIAELIFHVNDLTEFFRALHQALGQLIFTKNFIVAIRYEQQPYFVIPFACDEKDDIPHNTQVKIDVDHPSLTSVLFTQNEPLLLNQEEFKKYLENNKVHVRGTIPTSWLGVPFGEGNLQGAVLVQCYDNSYTFEYQDQQLLQYVAKHIYNAVERMEAKEQLEYLALHDPLTGLANRAFFKSQLSKSISKYERNPSLHFYVLYIDLDGFKLINDKFGHHFGDKLLAEVAQNMQESIREADTVCRLGGDEFALLINDIEVANDTNIQQLSQRLLDTINETIVIDGITAQVSASIGVVTSRTNRAELDHLLACADEAMYIAKSLGKNQVYFHESASIEHFMHSYAFPKYFTNSLTKKEFVLFGQPIVNVKSLDVVAIEVLIRWQHPELGLLMPNKFIEHITQSGLVEHLDLYVLEELITYLKLKASNLSPSFVFNINISPKGFVSQALLLRLAKLQEECPHLVKHICLELTEQSLASTIEETQKSISKIKRLGISVALDDFGTGYSSLNYLHQFQFDTLKIDRSFLCSYKNGGTSKTIFEAIINLSKSLNICVVAEGVESEDQLLMLKQLGCDKAQGYFFDKPMAFSHIDKLIQKK